MDEIRTFNTTGSWRLKEDLATSVLDRIREIASEDEAPWLKLGETLLRATMFRDDGNDLVVETQTRDGHVTQELEALRPTVGRPARDVPVTVFDKSGTARITRVEVESSSASNRRIVIRATVQWAGGTRNWLASGLNGISPEEQVESGLRAGLFGEPLPAQLGLLAAAVNSSDPLIGLDDALPHAVYEPAARLLIVERLMSEAGASRIGDIAIGPSHQGARKISASWYEAKFAVNVSPALRTITGTRTV